MLLLQLLISFQLHAFSVMKNREQRDGEMEGEREREKMRREKDDKNDEDEKQ